MVRKFLRKMRRCDVARRLSRTMGALGLLALIFCADALADDMRALCVTGALVLGLAWIALVIND